MVSLSCSALVPLSPPLSPPLSLSLALSVHGFSFHLPYPVSLGGMLTANFLRAVRFKTVSVYKSVKHFLPV